MCSRRSIRSLRAADSGFSLVEMLVAILLTGIALAVFVRDFGFTVQTRREMDLIAETQQALHATQTFVSQELRQAGACLPETGEFIALDAKDGGVVDELTIRIGVADAISLACLSTVLVQNHNAGDDELEVQDTSGFEVDQWIYVTRPGGQGATFRVASVDSDEIEIDGGLDANYPSGGGVYAIEERVYKIENAGALPILTVSVDGEEAQPLVAGVEAFDVRYRLEPCPPCTPVDEPASSSEWRSVREVEMRVVARSTVPKPQGGGFFRMEGTTAVRPRNLL